MAEQPPAKISYLNKSYEQVRAALLERAPIVSRGIWTDLNSAEMLVALLEMDLGVNDMMMFYQDRQTVEAFLGTATERKDVIAHCNTIGYRMKSWSAAQGSISLRLDVHSKIAQRYIEIPKYTEFLAVSGLSYFLLEPAFLNSAEPYATVAAAQGIPRSVNYIGTGDADQKYVIPSEITAEGSITVLVNEVPWTYVDDSFATSGPYDERYILRLDSSNRLHVLFGDNLAGKVPPQGTDIVIMWADTAGPIGNLALENQISLFKDVAPSGVSIHYSSTFSGGAEAETIEEAKRMAVMLLRSLWRGVHKDDFIALAESFPGIRQASVLDINDFPLYSFQISYYEVWIVVIPEAGEYPSEQLKQEVYDFLQERKYVTADIRVLDPEYIPIDLEGVIYKYKDYSSHNIMASVTNALEDFFKIARSPVASRKLTGTVDGRVLGEDVNISRLYDLLQSVPGVNYVDLTTPSGNFRINYKQIAVLGDVRLRVSDSPEEFGT
jgi:hypothetical protein